MSTEFIVVISVLGFGGLAAIFYISHALEQQRRRRALMIANLTDYCFRLQRLLDQIPPAYLSKDIKKLLLEQIKRRAERLTKLAPSKDRYPKMLDSTIAQLSELDAGTTSPPAPTLKTKQEADELRMLLQDLSRVIENFTNQKIIPINDGKKHLLSIQNSFIDANIKSMLFEADSARKDNKPKAALLHYGNVIRELKKRNQQHSYDEKIAQVNQVIQQIEQELALQKPSGEASTGETELDQAMNEILEAEDAWKKKYF